MFTTKFCFACGEKIDIRAEICPKCGVRQHAMDSALVGGQPAAVQPAAVQPVAAASEVSEKRIMPALLLLMFLGWFGIHHFYVGKKGTGVFLIICSISFIGLIITAIVCFFDFFALLFGNFKDSEDKPLKNW